MIDFCSHLILFFVFLYDISSISFMLFSHLPFFLYCFTPLCFLVIFFSSSLSFFSLFFFPCFCLCYVLVFFYLLFAFSFVLFFSFSSLCHCLSPLSFSFFFIPCKITRAKRPFYCDSCSLVYNKSFGMAGNAEWPLPKGKIFFFYFKAGKSKLPPHLTVILVL